MASAFSASKGRRVLYRKKKNHSVIFSLTNFQATSNRANAHVHDRTQFTLGRFREAVTIKLLVPTS